MPLGEFRQGRLEPAEKAAGESAQSHETLMAEIRARAERCRIVDELGSEEEGELDRLFFEFTPVEATNRERVSSLIQELERAAYIDPRAPVTSRKPAGRAVKWLVRKAVFWYINFVTGQILRFASYVTRLIVRSDERLADVEERLAAIAPRNALDSFGLQQVLDLGEWREQVLNAVCTAVRPALRPLDSDVVSRDAARGPAAAASRVLHADCQDGALVEMLLGSGIDAYGVDPRGSVIATGIARSLDLREEAVLAHLRSVLPASLGGMVLTGFVERLEPRDLAELLELSTSRIAAGGVLVLISCTPEAWARTRSAVEVDLALGKPLHALTWSTLLSRHGFENLKTFESKTGPRLSMLPGTHDAHSLANANFQILNDAIFPGTSYCIVGTRGG